MIERTYNIPLRKGFINTARHKKTKKAVTVLKEFLQRHMKSDDIKIGKNLNKFLWQHGIKNPPHHVKVQAVKDDEGVVKAELLGFKYEHLNKEQREKLKEEKPETKKETIKEEKPKVSKEEKKPKDIPEEKALEESLDAAPTDTPSTDAPKPKKKPVKKK